MRPAPADPDFPDSAQAALSAVRSALAREDRITVLTGAGISAESGIPTFRGKGGLWRDREVVRLATPEGFARDPELVWEFYNWRRGLLKKCAPNPAHLALAALERKKKGFVLITQNVDGLHEQAGSENILELHGNTWRTRCPGCGRTEDDRRAEIPYPPLCPDCGAMLRPDVVWFGESLDPAILGRAAQACREARVFLVVGTSAVVYPAASLTPLAKHSGATVIEVNLEPTPHTGLTDYSLTGPAGEILPRLLENG